MNNSTYVFDKGACQALLEGEVFDILRVVNYVCVIVTSLAGIVGNILNIVIFRRQGFRDGTVLSLLCLSVTDLMCSLTSLVGTLGFLINWVQVRRHHSTLKTISSILMGFLRTGFSQMSMFTTVILSLERCLCVVKPLTFKKLLTRRRTVIMLVLGHLETIVTYFLLLGSCRYSWTFDPSANATIFKRSDTKAYKEVLKVHSNLNGLVVTLTVVTVIIFTSCVTIFSLKRASRFRLSAQSNWAQVKVHIMSFVQFRVKY
ncbi:probable G-protein coupled receptor B0563.6 [Aplysia californica]|uniref:Probable G-protein coupled receptor B0563.6 n=1 Tax=Aplysia californica TaxID=6500 RepID=A0ABM0JBU5_APLCA|nr:probable G-protein coupled receptor B0563.6 [Aplysia californica]